MWWFWRSLYHSSVALLHAKGIILKYFKTAVTLTFGSPATTEQGRVGSDIGFLWRSDWPQSIIGKSLLCMQKVPSSTSGSISTREMPLQGSPSLPNRKKILLKTWLSIENNMYCIMLQQVCLVFNWGMGLRILCFKSSTASAQRCGSKQEGNCTLNQVNPIV